MRATGKNEAGTVLSKRCPPCVGIDPLGTTPTTTELGGELRDLFGRDACLYELLREPLDGRVALAELRLEPLALGEMLFLHHLVTRGALKALEVLAGRW